MLVNFKFNHDIDLVYKTLTDPQFLIDRALKLGSLDAQSEFKHVESKLQISLIRRRKINVPRVLRAVLKSIQTAKTEETWSRSGDNYMCQNATDIDGAPLTIKGNISLTPSTTGCTFSADFEPDAKVPFIGKKLEKYAGKTIAKEIELECEYTVAYLDKQSE